MLHDPRVRVVSFTGSDRGRAQAAARGRDNVVKPAMELGGNAPFIVFEDATSTRDRRRHDRPECATWRGLHGRQPLLCARAGARRVHPEADAKMAALKMGNGLDDGGRAGRWSTPKDATRSRAGRGRGQEGRQVLTGGSAPTARLFLSGTVLDNVPDGASLLSEEIFGPVAAIQTFRSRTKRSSAPTTPNTASWLSLYKDLSAASGLGKVGLRHDRGSTAGLVSDRPLLRRHQAERARPRRRHEGLMEFLETQYVSMIW